MRFVVSIETSGTGHLYYAPEGATALTEITLPWSVQALDYPPTFVAMRGRVYVYGSFSPCLVVTEDMQAAAMGLAPLLSAPAVTASGAAGVTGTFECAITQVHKLDGAVIHESNMSPAASVTCTAQARAWVVQANGFAPRATHWRAYVRASTTSEWRFAFERAVGVTTATDTVDTLALGWEAPENNDVPPYQAFARYYGGRVYGAGDPIHPNYVWFSESGKPEAVDALSALKTKGSEAVTGIKNRGNQLYVMNIGALDAIRGYDESTDLRMDRVIPGYGCISHHSILNIDERLIWASVDGPVILDGALPRLAGEKIRTYWQTLYKATPSEFTGSFACYDYEKRYYLLHLRKTSGMFRFAGWMPPVAGGEAPFWVFDERNRTDTAIGVVSSSGRPLTVVGSSDGYLREENVAADYDDDGDTDSLGVGIKRMTIISRHEPGDDDDANLFAGKKFNDLGIFLTAENNTWVASAWGGQVQASLGTTPHWTSGTVAASYDATLTPLWEHPYTPEGIGGAGVTLKLVIEQARATNVRFQGYAWGYSPGGNARTLVA